MIIQKIKRRIKNAVVAFKKDIKFSKKLAFYRLLTDLFDGLRIKKLYYYFRNKKDQSLLKFISISISQPLKKYKTATNLGTHSDDAPIWICWWQGIDSAPPLIKQCISSIQKFYTNVIIIDSTNFSNYVHIPDFLIHKLKSGKILHAHFCDYLRVALIYENGGLWLDSTIFCTKTIPRLYLNSPFFTCKSEVEDIRYFSKKRWTTFVMSGYKNSDFIGYLRDSIEAYWIANDSVVDYLMFDYIIELGASQNPFFASLINNVPPSNPHRDDLQEAMNARLPAEEFEKFLHNETVLYKLSWRETYDLKTIDGNESIYSRFLNFKFGDINDS